MICQLNSTQTVSTSRGDTVERAKLLVGDRSKKYFTITLWAAKTAWVDECSVGDIVIFENLKIGSWQGSLNATPVYSSKMEVIYPRSILASECKFNHLCENKLRELKDLAPRTKQKLECLHAERRLTKDSQFETTLNSLRQAKTSCTRACVLANLNVYLKESQRRRLDMRHFSNRVADLINWGLSPGQPLDL
jgi:hypothetical protein